MPVVPVPAEPLTMLRGILFPRHPRIRVLFNESCPFTSGRVLTSRFRVVFDFHDQLPENPIDDGAVLERQYERFNIGEDEVAAEYRRRKLRSLSVGDLVAVNTRYYACDSRGWTPVSRSDVRLVIPELPPRHRRVHR